MKLLITIALLGSILPSSLSLAQDSTQDSAQLSQGIQSSDQDTTSAFTLGGRLMFDYGSVSDQSSGSDIRGFDVRSARIAISGNIRDTINYKMVSDIAGDKVSFKDVHAQYSGQGYNVIIGQSKESISQDGQAGKTNSTFMEKASVASITGLTHQLGVAVDFGSDNWGWKTGVYAGSLNGNNKGAITIASRAIYGGTLKNATWGVATSLRFRDANGQEDYEYKVKAHNSFSLYYLDLGQGSQKDTFYGFDVAFTQGPFHASVETGQFKVKKLTISDSSLNINSGYVEAGYFLTGEKRVYDLRKGKWGFSQVINPFFEGGSGALQLVARYDIIDMSGKTSTAGGNQKTLLLGLNWWPNTNTRFVINYNNSRIKNGFTSGLNSEDGTNTVNGLGIRLVTVW